MRIFVTGGAGYIGSVCTEQLLNEGHEVAIFDNLSEGHRHAVDPRARFIEGDLADRVPIDETASPRPISPYGESKLTFEKLLRWYDEIYGVKFVCLRYFNASGDTKKFGEDHRPETHLIPAVLQVALGQRPNLEIYGTDYETPDGTCIRDYIHIVDLAQAHILALGTTSSGFYNL